MGGLATAASPAAPAPMPMFDGAVCNPRGQVSMYRPGGAVAAPPADGRCSPALASPANSVIPAKAGIHSRPAPASQANPRDLASGECTGRANFMLNYPRASVAQRIERVFAKDQVVGSNPTGRTLKGLTMPYSYARLSLSLAEAACFLAEFRGKNLATGMVGASVVQTRLRPFLI